MKKYYLLFTLLLLFCQWQSAHSAVKLFVLAGQSNMEGHAQTGQLRKLLCAVEELEPEQDGCYREVEDVQERLFKTISDFYWTGQEYGYGYEATQAHTEAAALFNSAILHEALLQPLDAVQCVSFQYRRMADGSTRLDREPRGALSTGFGNSSGKYGPELSLGHILHAAFPGDDIILLKVVQGGADLHEQWRSPAMEQRLGTADKESLYPKLIEHVRALQNNPGAYFPRFQSGAPQVELGAFFWFQGFNDAVEGSGVFAENYAANLRDLLNDLRRDLAAPNLPIVIAQSHADNANGLIVRQAQAQVAANLSGTLMIQTNDLSNYYHYDAASHIIIGERLGNAWLARQREPGAALLRMPRLTGDTDYSTHTNAITVNETPAASSGYPDLSSESLGIQLQEKPRTGAFTLCFKLIPSGTEYNGLIYNGGYLEIYQEGAALRSEYETGGINGADKLRNSAPLKTRSCNHFAVVIDGNNHRNYLNGVMAEHGTGGDATRRIEGLLTFGPWPGELWDIHIYDYALSDSEIAELSELCRDAAVAEPPHADYPYPFCGPYICLWGNSATDFAEEPFQYYLHAQDKTYRHNIFEVGMYPADRLDEYVLDPAAPGRNLAMAEGIVNTFVKDWSFTNPLKRENSNFWVHENFHSFQGPLARANGFAGTKFMLEATAEWGSDAYIPGTISTLLGYYTLNPHLPLWADQSVPLAEIGWQADGHGGHQYGAYIWFAYLTHNLVGKNLIGRMFNDPRVSYEPIHLLKDILADEGFVMEEIFGEYAARTVTFDYPYGQYYADSEQRSWQRLQSVIDGAVNRKFAAVYGPEGTAGEWNSPAPEVMPGSWAYNTCRMDVAQAQDYTVSFKGAAANPSFTDFRVWVVLYTPGGLAPAEREYYTFTLSPAVVRGEQAASMEISAAAGQSVYLVVATTPDIYTGFDTYNYRYNIAAKDPVSAEADRSAAGGVVLYPVLPNPLWEKTAIRYYLPHPARTRLELIDIASGRMLNVLDAGQRAGGTYSIMFSPQGMAHGVYGLRLLVDGIPLATQTMLIAGP